MNKRFTTTCLIALAAILTAGQLRLQIAQASKNNDSDRFAGISKLSRRMPEIVPGRLLVKYRASLSSARRNNLMMAAGARVDREIPGLGLQVMQLPEGADMEAYSAALRSQPEVEFVEPDYLVYPAGEMVPDDPLYGSQWHLPAVSCPAAWGMTTGSDQIIIALCDTGVEATHPDLAAKLVPGWNVVDHNADTSPVSSHGTWTAGTAAAAGNNAIGIASPALDCRIMPVRVSSLASGGALISDLAAGVVWAADHGARIASVSYMGAASSSMTDAGKYIATTGGVLVMAAGNTGAYDALLDTPDIIVISATSEGDSMAGFSTTGSHIDLSAPGSNILTTAPGSTYQAVNGTSFSAPLVAGAIGLMLSLNPSLTPAQIDTILKVSSDDLGPAGWDSGYGWGRLNVARAIDLCEALLTGALDASRPAVGFLQPQIGGPSSGLIGISVGELVKVNAIDDRAVTSVSLAADGVAIGTASVAPYTFYIDTSSYADGSNHTLTATATDGSGNQTSITTTVTASLTFDATPPTVSFVRPQVADGKGAIGQSSSESIVVDAQDNRAISEVSLIADGSIVQTLTAAPYAFSWDTSGFAAGSQHELSAAAGDQGNNWTVLTITVTVAAPAIDTTRPIVSFVQPQAGGTVAQSTGEMISVAASDDVGVASVSLFADNKPIGTATSAPFDFPWNTSSMSAGSRHTLKAVASDLAGNSTSVSIVVTVRDTLAPEVSFKSPDDGDLISGSQNVSISAKDDVGVSLVELYIDGELSASWTKGPYNKKWNSTEITKGLHSLKCVAYDAAGNSASASIAVTVE